MEISNTEILFLIHCLVWCVKGSSIYNHAYPCINNSCIANIVVYSILVIHPIIVNRLVIHDTIV